MITAHDLMTEDPVTVPMMGKVRDAARLLQALDVRHLPVVDEEGTLVGMLSDRDLRGLSLPEVIGAEYLGTVQTALDTPISSIMSSDVISVGLESDVAEIIDMMVDSKVGAVPVVDTDGTLVGIVSYVDILHAFPTDEELAAPRIGTNGARRDRI